MCAGSANCPTMNSVKSFAEVMASVGSMPHAGSMPAMISALARAMFSRVLRCMRWLTPTLVMAASTGRAARVIRSICPRPSMPISSTSASVSAGALSSVRGMPMRLL